MNSNYFVENALILDGKQLKQVFTKIRKEYTPKIQGEVEVKSEVKKSLLNYWTSVEDAGYLNISADGHDQKIQLEDFGLTFGLRTYFVCVCGKKVSKLYRPDGKSDFLCRECHNLYYRLNSLNPYSKHGKFLYLASRTAKLVEARTRIDRIFYKGKYTKRFLAFLRQCDRALMYGPKEDAENLMSAING